MKQLQQGFEQWVIGEEDGRTWEAIGFMYCC